MMINADLNGALNIIRKAIPNAFADGIEGVGLPPSKVSVGTLVKFSNDNE